jgi:hypothetical protein
MIDENLAMPFETTVLGVPVTVERHDLNHGEQIVAVCTRGRSRQLLPILDLPLPTPPPDGAEWIEAWRACRRMTPFGQPSISGRVLGSRAGQKYRTKLRRPPRPVCWQRNSLYALSAGSLSWTLG